MSANIDTSELDVLGDDLATSIADVMDEVVAITERGAMNIKRDARRRIGGLITRTYLPHYPKTIDYDIHDDALSVEAEIGPRTDMPQGGMGRGVEFGSIRTPPHPHLLPAFEDEVVRWALMLERRVGDVIL